MLLGERFSSIPVYEPTPVPFVVFESEMVGFSERLQQIPRSVTGRPPSDDILDKQVADVIVIFITSPVVTRGACSVFSVVKYNCIP